jgi:beta-N-acetylhexosaminidase
MTAACLVGSAQAQSLEDMAGQMIVVGFQGDGPNDASVVAMREAIAAGEIGGVMFLRTNVASLDAVTAMNEGFRAARPELVPFITLDQEGGSVERLTRDVGFTEVPDAESVAERYSVEEAEALYRSMASAIADLGFTVNFGPVADLNLNTSNPVIARFGRSFSADAQTVVDYDGAFIRAHMAEGVLTSLKHFPGHGSSRTDSHEGFTDITDTWDPAELEPYRAFIQAGYNEFVMVGHLYHEDYSGGVDGLPSSLTPRWIDGVLRDELGFTGVVISDDLEMGAIREHFSLEETVTQAVRAGMDVLLFSNTAQTRASLGDEIRAILVAEAQADPAFAERIAESYQRIVTLKGRLN